jgi:hypothetical protein
LINGAQKSSREKSLLPVQKLSSLGIAVLLLLVFNSFQKVNQAVSPNPAAVAVAGHYPSVAGPNLILQFRVYMHGEPLELNKKYRNPYGEIFEMTRLRFYAGNISPVYLESGHKTNSTATYHLIDVSDSSSCRVEIPALPGSFRSLYIQLGIDSADQNRGAQTGALDPIKGMFWTWNSGYLTLKMEGTSESSNQPAHLMAYHIGGYRYPNSTIWKILLSQDQIIRLPETGKITLEIPVELDYFFSGRQALRIKEIADCTTPGDLARKISENFAGSFTGFTHITNP